MRGVVIFVAMLPLLWADARRVQVGTVFRVNGRSVEVAANKTARLSTGMRVLVETPAGLVSLTVGEVYHTKVRAFSDAPQAQRIVPGNSVFLMDDDGVRTDGKKIMEGPGDQESETERYK